MVFWFLQILIQVIDSVSSNGLLLQPSITLHHGLQEYRALTKWGMHKLSSLQNFTTVTEYVYASSKYNL